MKIKLDDGAICPTRSHPTDAGLDLYSREEKTIYPLKAEFKPGTGLEYQLSGGETFDTGVHIELPPLTFGKLESRSGLNVKHSVVSCGGVIDVGYTGSIIVKLYNLGDKPYTVHAGDRIAQLVILPYYKENEIEIVEELNETDRNNNGIGSSGR